MTSVINFINTGTGANAGNGDSLRTAFNKINQNFVDLENSYVQSGVASFNGTGGVITFTATDITNLLGFIPYNSGNPSQYVTQSSVDGLASLLYLNSNFVTTATILNYTTKNYVDTNLAQYTTLDFLAAQNYISNVTLPSFLSFYATEAWVGVNFISTSTIGQYLNQGKTDLLPVIANTYDIGNQLLTWKTLYLSDSIYIDNYVITVNTVTNKLMVDNQGLTGNYSFDPQNIYNNDVSFDINASYDPLISPTSVAGIHFPNNTEASISSIRVYNTATGGVVLGGKTTQVLVDEGTIPGVEVRGNIKLPVSFSDGNVATGHRIVINPNVIGLTTTGFRVDFYDQPIAITAINSGTSNTPVRMSIIGNEVAIFSRWEGLSNQATVLSVTTSGVFIGTTNTGYVLPGAIGGTGTTLVSDGQGLVSWSTQTFGSSNINSENAVFTTATITKRFRLGTEGLTFYDGSNMITAYGNQQVSDFLPQYTGALSVGYIAGLGTNVSLISNGLTWAFSATGVLSLPSGGQIGELYGNGVDIRSNPSGYVKLVSNSGNNYLKIDNLGAYIFATNKQWEFGTDGRLTLPAGGDIVDSSGASVLGGGGGTGIALGDRLTTGSYSVVLGADGSLTLPIGVTIDESNGSHFPRIVADTGKAFSVQGYGSTGSVALQWAETASTSSQIAQVGLNKFGDDGLAKVTLTAGTSTDAMKVWRFAADGSLTLPGDLHGATDFLSAALPDLIVIGHTLNITPAPNVSDKKFGFRIDQTGETFDRAFLDMPTAENNKAVSLTFSHANNTIGNIFVQGTDSVTTQLNNAFNIFYNSGDIKVTAQGLGSVLHTWNFANDGDLTIPGDILAPTGQTITMQSDQNSQLQYQNANIAVAPNIATNTTFSVQPNFATLAVGYRDGSSNEQDNTWLWNIDGMTLPEGSVISETTTTTVITPPGAAAGWVFGTTGTLTVPGSIIPETDIAYDLGSPSNRFRDLYLSTSTIYLGAATISAVGSALELPVGTTTGGVSIGTIIILGSVADSTALTAISTATLTVGDSYVVASPAPAHLWTWNSTAFIDLGVFQGPKGDLGYTGSQGVGFTGSTGYTGSNGSNGFVGSRGYTGSNGSNGFVGSRGYTGSSGSAGTQGIIGFTGSFGFIGSAGIGFVGSQGAAGASGISFSISASGSSDYVFSGPGIFAGNTDDPVLYLYRGFTYTFVNTTGGAHPFAIRVSNGGAEYTTGVSGSQSGTQTFIVPMNAPSTLYYQCIYHSSMGNVINIV